MTLWQRWRIFHYPHAQIDFENMTSRGWLRSARKALYLSGSNVAAKLGISPNTLIGFEQGEKMGTITLKNLAKCADAMGCELIYSIRPKEKRTFAEAVWKALVNNTDLSGPTTSQIYKLQKRIRSKEFARRPL